MLSDIIHFSVLKDRQTRRRLSIKPLKQPVLMWALRKTCLSVEQRGHSKPRLAHACPEETFEKEKRLLKLAKTNGQAAEALCQGGELAEGFLA